MNDIESILRELLNDTVRAFRQIRMPDDIFRAFADLGRELDALVARMDEPCIVAVVGRMKAGKSTFINALLGEDLAKVGVTETTATINTFRYGVPSDPVRPIRCHWKNGQITDEPRDFLDSLQGNSDEVLKRADGIDRLEYRLNNPFLERIELVDTPGLSAVVGEHVSRTSTFLNLQEKHESETVRLGGSADAVIYLVGPVARAADQDFLSEFSFATSGHSHPSNAVGVVAKIDLHPDVLARRTQLAGRIAEQLRESLNTVLPVSAGIHQFVHQLETSGKATEFLATLAKIPLPQLKKWLDNEEFFFNLEAADCPVTPAERRELVGASPWSVFTTLVEIAMQKQFDAPTTIEEWHRISGFRELRQLLETHFVRRGHLLRWHQILNHYQAVLDQFRYTFQPKLREHYRAEAGRMQRMVSFVQSATGDAAAKSELLQLLSRMGGTSKVSDEYEQMLRQLETRAGQIRNELDITNGEFVALQLIEDHRSLFTTAELDELRPLFGLYANRGDASNDFDALAKRQQHWMMVNQRDRERVRREVAECAVAGYGRKLESLSPG